MLLDAEGQATQRIAIVTPCQDTVTAGYALDLVRLVSRTLLALPGLDMTVVQVRGTMLPQQRHDCVMRAKQANASHILWIDADMRFPADALIQLLAHDQPIVACNYTTRRAPYIPTAERLGEGKLFTDNEADGLIAVTSCGMGLMLTQMRVFDELDAPWFAIGYVKGRDLYSGEDVFFCKKARDHGYSIQIDQGLSRFVEHTGAIDFTNTHALLTQEAASGA